MNLRKTIQSKAECKQVAQYLFERHKGNGGAGLLQEALQDGNIDSLEHWIHDYGLTADHQVWRKASQWLFNQRHKKANDYSSIRVKRVTLTNLNAFTRARGHANLSEAIDALLDGADDRPFELPDGE